MYEVKNIKASNIIPEVIDLLEQGLRVRITVTGMSMYPFLRGNLDSVELTSTNISRINRGDIVLILRDDGIYILHRVLRKENDCFYIVGDAQQWIEGPLRPEQLVAKVTTIWRRNKCIHCSNKRMRLLTIIWRLLLPFRYKIIRNYRRLHRIFSRRTMS